MSGNDERSHERKATRFQSFVPERVHRSALKNAPYNPRQALHPELAQRLRDNLATVGLVEPLTWNKTTGLLVGGHQRLAALDALTGHGDYFLDVAAVQLNPKVEREQNVFLNNQAVQGDWDLVALQTLFKQPGFSVEAAGFSEIDVLDVFGPQVHADIFGDMTDLGALAAELNRSGSQPVVEGVEGDVLLILFASRADREQFMISMGCEPDERYIDAGRILDEMGLDTRQEWGKAMAAP